MAFTYYSMYQRIVLGMLSETTWVNLNFALCFSTFDPWIPLVGKSYLFWAEFYLNFCSYLTKLAVMIPAEILAYLFKKVKKPFF